MTNSYVKILSILSVIFALTAILAYVYDENQDFIDDKASEMKDQISDKASMLYHDAKDSVQRTSKRIM